MSTPRWRSRRSFPIPRRRCERWPIEIPRSLVEYILLGPAGDRRQLQDSPILGDVWIAFARTPEARLDLLITPLRDKSAGEPRWRSATADQDDRRAGGRTSATCRGSWPPGSDFEDVLRVVVPMTEWWHNPHESGRAQEVHAASDGRRGLIADDRPALAHRQELEAPGADGAGARLCRPWTATSCWQASFSGRGRASRQNAEAAGASSWPRR